MAAKKETQEIKELIESYLTGSEVYDVKPLDSNHWLRRMFRLYIDGSYSYPGNEPGFKFYERLIKTLKELKASPGKSTDNKYRMMAIMYFVDMLHVEFPGVSKGTIQKIIVKTFGKEIENFNEGLISDLKDLLQD